MGGVLTGEGRIEKEEIFLCDLTLVEFSGLVAPWPEYFSYPVLEHPSATRFGWIF